MKVNGVEITKAKELKLHKAEKKELVYIVNNCDYREGASALDSLKYVNSKIRELTNSIKIDKLIEKQNSVRSNNEWDRIEKQIQKLRN